VAGDSLQFKIQVPDYSPAAGWTLHYALLHLNERVDIEATASDDDWHVFEIPPATTVNFVPEEYSVRGYVTNAGGDRHTVWRDGTVIVLPDPITGDAVDERSTAKKILDQIDGIIENRTQLNRDKGEFTVDGQKVKYRDFDELLRTRRHYAGIYEDEEDEKYGISQGPGMVRLTFSGP
jgi:hypothetical protein